MEVENPQEAEQHEKKKLTVNKMGEG